MGELKNTCRSLEKDIASIIRMDPKSDEAIRSSLKSAAAPKNNTYLKSKDTMLLNSIKKSADQLSRSLLKDFDMNISDEKRKKFSVGIGLIASYERAIKESQFRKAAMILADIAEIDVERKGVKFMNRIPFPDEIKEFMVADIEELEKTFNASCYRSSIIICGRLLETALHRKFYEKTQTDILEKHPEIGLGKIIAKLEESNVEMPPGLTQQIHLINQARIHSVHKKKEAFLPSREQAYAVILFTIDVLKKLF